MWVPTNTKCTRRDGGYEMAKEWAKAFYKSKQWQQCQQAYLKSQGYICERCGDVAVLVHHKHYLTPNNIGSPVYTTNWANLEALCQDCHNKEHHKHKTEKRYKVDEHGRVVIAPRS